MVSQLVELAWESIFAGVGVLTVGVVVDTEVGVGGFAGDQMQTVIRMVWATVTAAFLPAVLPKRRCRRRNRAPRRVLVWETTQAASTRAACRWGLPCRVCRLAAESQHGGPASCRRSRSRDSESYPDPVSLHG